MVIFFVVRKAGGIGCRKDILPALAGGSIGGVSVEEQIRSFLESTFLFEFGDDVADDTDLFKAGIMDSFGYVQLVNFLKNEFHIAFTDEEILTNIMVSFERIMAFVRGKQATMGQVAQG